MLSSGQGFMLNIEHDISEEVIKSVKVPTLIIHSSNDNAVLFEHALHANKHINNSELFEAETWGYLLWIGCGAKEVGEKVNSFLNG